MSESENNLIIKLQFAESVIRDQDGMLADKNATLERIVLVCNRIDQTPSEKINQVFKIAKEELKP